MKKKTLLTVVTLVMFSKVLKFWEPSILGVFLAVGLD
jgi:hypothetical protein